MYNVSGLRNICFQCSNVFVPVQIFVKDHPEDLDIFDYWSIFVIIYQVFVLFFSSEKTIHFDFLGSELKPLSLLKLFMMAIFHAQLDVF